VRILVVGGTGLIGRQLVDVLGTLGHDAVPASPHTGVDTVTTRGLSAAIRGAQVVVDVSKPRSYSPEAVLDYFTASTRHLLEADRAAGVRHHLTLAAVGTDRLTHSGFYRAKKAQEDLVRGSGIPFTLVRSTQFYEFALGIAASATRAGVVKLPPAEVQPMASRDVASFLADEVVGAPRGDVVEFAGPETLRLDAFVSAVLGATGDPRSVIADDHADYFGGRPGATTLVASDRARRSVTTLGEWLRGEAH
jgi:uncharacterized protein YbjT (DUF2867 family)